MLHLLKRTVGRLVCWARGYHVMTNTVFYHPFIRIPDIELHYCVVCDLIPDDEGTEVSDETD